MQEVGKLLATDADFFSQFTVVIACDVPTHALHALAEALWTHGVSQREGGRKREREREGERGRERERERERERGRAFFHLCLICLSPFLYF